MLNLRGQFVISNTPARGQLSINSVTSYACNAADIIDDDNYVTVLEIFIILLLLHVVTVFIKKVSWLDHLVLTKKWGISPEIVLNKIPHTMQHRVHPMLHPSLSRPFRTNDHQL